MARVTLPNQAGRFGHVVRGVIGVATALLLSLTVLVQPTPVFAQAACVEVPPVDIQKTSCQNQGTINVDEYVAPDCGGGDCPHVGSSSVSSDASYLGNVDNWVQWVNGDTFKQNSNDIHFLYKIDGGRSGGMIRFLQDTIWNPFVCDGSGLDAMYRVYRGSNVSSNDWGGDYLRTRMSCGEGVTNTGFIRAYEYNNAVEQDPFMGLNECSVAGQSKIVTTGTNELFFQGNVKCNGQDVDAIGVRNLSGAGAGEVLFYCKGLGLCAWYQNLDFTSTVNDPGTWVAKKADICQLKAGGAGIGADKYYVEHIDGLREDDQNRIVDSLIKQGYKVSCTTPEITVSGQWAAHPPSILDLLPTDVTLTPTAVFDEDISSSYWPILQDDSGGPSYENYFGNRVRIIPGGSDADDPLPAPVYSLLTLTEQCQQQVKILRAIKEKCDNYALYSCPRDPNLCPLWEPDPRIKSQGYNSYKDLLADFDQSGLTCQQIGDGTGRNQYAGFERLTTALNYVPLNLSKIRRYAFLVISAQQVYYEGPAKFSFLSEKTAPTDMKHDVRVIRILMPDVSTNKDPEGPGYYRDSASITTDAVRSLEDQEAHQQAAAEARAQLANASPGGEPPISCGKNPVCDDPLPAALIRFINMNGQYCNPTMESLKYEPVKQIGATTFSPDSEIQAGYFMDDKMVGTNTEQPEPFSFLSRIMPRIEEGDGDTTFNTYLILPQGTDPGDEMEYVERLLGGLIFSNEEQYQEFKTDASIPSLYKMLGISLKFDSSKPQLQVPFPPNWPEAQVDENGNPTRYGTLEAEVIGDTTNRETRVPGAHTGQLWLLLQRGLSEPLSLAERFWKGCKTFEEGLLLRCNQAGSPGTPPPTEEALEPVAQCVPGSRRITSGETAHHYCATTGQQCTPAEIQAQSRICSLYVSNEHSVEGSWRDPYDPVQGIAPTSPEAIKQICDQLYSYVACTYPKSLIQNKVNESGTFDNNGSLTACEYIIREASNQGVSPRYVMSICLEESGLEAKGPAGDTAALCGNTVFGDRTNLRDQVTAVVNTIKDKNYLTFLRRFSGENRSQDVSAPNEFCHNPYFPARVKTFYDYL